jgi:hypothetical protein
MAVVHPVHIFVPSVFCCAIVGQGVNEVLLARRIADHKYSLSIAFDRIICCFKVCVTLLLQLCDYPS